MAKELDEHAEDFHTRPLADGPYTFVAAEALAMRVREGGRVAPIHTYVANGVNNGAHRKILSLQMAFIKKWNGFQRSLVASITITPVGKTKTRALERFSVLTGDAAGGWAANLDSKPGLYRFRAGRSVLQMRSG